MAVYFQPADKYSVRNIGVLALGNALGTAIDSLIKGQIAHNKEARQADVWNKVMGPTTAEEYQNLTPEMAATKMMTNQYFGRLTPEQQKMAMGLVDQYNQAYYGKMLRDISSGSAVPAQASDNITVASGQAPVSTGQSFIGRGKVGDFLPQFAYYATKAGLNANVVDTLMNAALDKQQATAVDTGGNVNLVGYSPITGQTSNLYSAQKTVSPDKAAMIAAEKEIAKNRDITTLKAAAIRGAYGGGYGDQGYGGLVRLSAEDLKESHDAILETAKTDPQKAYAQANTLRTYLPKNDAAIVFINQLMDDIDAAGGKTSGNNNSGGKVVKVEKGSYAQNRNKKK